MGGYLLSRRVLLTSLAALPVVGCEAKIGVQSNKDAAYQRKLDRVLIVLTLAKAGVKTYLKSNEIRESFAAQWQPLGVTFDVIDIENPSEKAQTVSAAIERYRPNQVLDLAVVSTTIAVRYVDAFTLEGQVLDVASKKRIWRSVITFDDNGMLKGRAYGDASKKNTDKFVALLTDRLRADGLI